MAESEELKSLLMRVKEENAKAGLKLNSKKKKTNKDPGILSHHFMTNKREKSGSSEIFFPLCSKITLDGDCSHGNQISQHLDLGFPFSKTVRNGFLWFKPHGLWYCVTAA